MKFINSKLMLMTAGLLGVVTAATLSANDQAMERDHKADKERVTNLMESMFGVEGQIETDHLLPPGWRRGETPTDADMANLLARHIKTFTPRDNTESVIVRHSQIESIAPDTRGVAVSVAMEKGHPCYPRLGMVVPPHQQQILDRAESRGWDLRIEYIEEECYGTSASLARR